MPTIYPAMKLKMGTPGILCAKSRWKMLRKQINFAGDITGDHTINEAIQRELNEGRAKTDAFWHNKTNVSLILLLSQQWGEIQNLLH